MLHIHIYQSLKMFRMGGSECKNSTKEDFYWLIYNGHSFIAGVLQYSEVASTNLSPNMPPKYIHSNEIHRLPAESKMPFSSCLTADL